jgi:hypothetical protein
VSNAKREATLNKYNKLSVVWWGFNIVVEQSCIIRKYSLLGFSWRVCDALLLKTRVLNTKNEVLGT